MDPERQRRGATPRAGDHDPGGIPAAIGPPAMRRCGVLLALVVVPTLAGCARDPATEALESLSASAPSPRYHSGFWADEAAKQSSLWTRAQTYCRVPDNEDRPNCRIVVAVDVTVRVLAVRPGDDLNERVRQWVRGGTKELGLDKAGAVPPYVPGRGFARSEERRVGKVCGCG